MGKIMKEGKQYGVGGQNLKTTEVTVTTSPSGSAPITGNANNGYLVMAVAPTNVDKVVIPVCGQGGSWWVKVFNWDFTPYASQSVTLRVYYTEK